METPTQEQARSHYARQAAIAAAASRAVWPLFEQGRPLAEIAQLIAQYQYAAASAAALTLSRWAGRPQATTPTAFAGVSSQGFPVIEPVITTIDRIEPAPPEPLPAPWWEEVTLFQHSIELLIASEVADAARGASASEMVAQGWVEYVRVLTPPSCGRCAILAGRVYHYSTGFQRHPGCDCQMVPVTDRRDAEDLLIDPRAAFERGEVKGMSKADLRAIADGANPSRVVNATRGLGAPGITAAGRTNLFGRRVKYTTDNVTKRSQWRKANPTRMVRLRPESIYQFASDPADARRLLKLYGYIT